MTLDGFIAAFTQHRDRSIPNADQEAENARLRMLVRAVLRVALYNVW